MIFTAAVVKEQGVKFAVVAVRPFAMAPLSRGSTLSWFQPRFRGLPIVLMSQDSSGSPTYYGRHDISQFLANLQPEQLPWAKYFAN